MYLCGPSLRGCHKAGVKQFQLYHFAGEELALMLKALPNVVTLGIQSRGQMDDAHLQAVAACTSLVSFSLYGCQMAGPDGVLALCKRLPSLRLVCF